MSVAAKAKAMYASSSARGPSSAGKNKHPGIGGLGSTEPQIIDPEKVAEGRAAQEAKRRENESLQSEPSFPKEERKECAGPAGSGASKNDSSLEEEPAGSASTSRAPGVSHPVVIVRKKSLIFPPVAEEKVSPQSSFSAASGPSSSSVPQEDPLTDLVKSMLGSGGQVLTEAQRVLQLAREAKEKRKSLIPVVLPPLTLSTTQQSSSSESWVPAYSEEPSTNREQLRKTLEESRRILEERRKLREEEEERARQALAVRESKDSNTEKPLTTIPPSVEQIQRLMAQYNGSLPDVEDEKQEEPVIEPRKPKKFRRELRTLVGQYQGNPLQSHIEAMVKAAIEEKEYVVPVDEVRRLAGTASSDAADSEEALPSFAQILPFTINANILNIFFKKNGSKPVEKGPPITIKMDDETTFDIDHLEVSAEDIASHPLPESERKGVKKVNIFCSDISDAVIDALVVKFPDVEEVTLSLCSAVTDVGVGHLAGWRLKSLNILFCPKVTENGLDSLVEHLQPDQLESFSLSTKAPIMPSTLQKLALFKGLKLLDFNICPNLTSEGLMFFQNVKGVRINVRACYGIDPMAIEALNKGREDQPLIFRGEPMEPKLWLPRMLEPPPEVPLAEDVFTMQTVQKCFPERNAKVLPHGSELSEFSFPMRFRGIDLSNIELPDEALNALIDRYPGMKVVRLDGCTKLGQSGIIHLRHLLELEQLYIGNIPVALKWIETMFSETQGGPKRWRYLKDLYLAGMPVSDLALKYIASRPRLEKVDLSGCDRITYQGLRPLIDNEALKYLAINDCPGIDLLAIREIQRTRPDIVLKADNDVDRSAISLAILEANQRMRAPKEKRCYVFLQESGPIPETQAVDLNETAVFQFYREMFKVLGLRDERIEEIIRNAKEPMHLDQILQAYQDISRVARAFIKELYRVGFFTNQDAEQVPQTVEELLLYLSEKDTKGTNRFREKIQFLDLSGLGLWRFPDCLAKPLPRLKEVQLEGNHIKESPESLALQLRKGVSQLAPPPLDPGAGKIFSMETVRKIFPDGDSHYFPRELSLEMFNFSTILPNFTEFAGVDLSDVNISGDSFNALIDRFPGMKMLRLNGCTNLGQSGIIHIRHLLKIERLYVVNCPATLKWMEILLSETPVNGGHKPWQFLKNIYLAGMPISDIALGHMSAFPKLEKTNLSECNRITYQGLQLLMKRPTLKYLSINDCPGIDLLAIQECREARPDITLRADIAVDPSAVALAIEEARRRMNSKEDKEYAFLPKVDPAEKKGSDVDQTNLSSYIEKLKILGLREEAIQELIKEFNGCMFLDQILQSYQDISRVAWALIKELDRIGFFTDQDSVKPPQTVEELLQCLDTKDEVKLIDQGKKDISFCGKVSALDLSGLGLRHIPYCILDRHWPRLESIELDGNYMKEAPANLVSQLKNKKKHESLRKSFFSIFKKKE